jgi:thiamine kinase-like enzyme
MEADPATGLLITVFIEGQALREQDGRNEENLRDLAAVLRRLHAGQPFNGAFDLASIRARYQAVALAGSHALPEVCREVPPVVTKLEALLAEHREPSVPCHNDLVPANVIATPDHRLWLIDYEFSSMNEASFELGNLVNEWRLDQEQARQLVRAYWGRDSRSKCARVEAWAYLAAYTWLLWAVIQQATNASDDVLASRLRRFDELHQAVTGSLPRLLDALASAD